MVKVSISAGINQEYVDWLDGREEGSSDLGKLRMLKR